MNNELQQFFSNNKNHKWRPKPPIPQDIWTSDWPWVPYEKEIDPYLAFSELQAIDDLFVEHREDDKVGSYGHKGWSSICLHGIGWDKTEEFTQYGYKNEQEVDYHWTSICSKLPYLTNLAKSFEFDNLKRVRIMRLAPGGFIMPHADGKGRTFGPFNFALTQPPGCDFVFEGYGVVPFRVGRGFLLDLGVRHAVYNNSDQVRYHLIIHGNPLRPMMQKVINAVKSLKQYEHSN